MGGCALQSRSTLREDRMKLHLIVLGCVVMCAAAVGADTKPKAPETKPKTEIVLDTPENALRTYITAWQNTDYAGIIASVKITDEKKKPVVESYVTYMMWSDALERACVAKFGEDEGMKALGHVRTFVKQYELDLNTRLRRANVEYADHDRGTARIFLREERDRPKGLQVDKLSFRDDYSVVKDGSQWKIDFLKTYELSDPEREDEINYNAYQAYPPITKHLKELTEQVKAGKMKLADDVKTAIENMWAKVAESAK